VKPIAAANPKNRFAANLVEYFDEVSLGGGPEVELSLYEDHTQQIVSENDSPDLGFRYSINPYRGCFHGCAYCLSGETRILMADGSTKPLADVGAGDQVVGTERYQAGRRFVPSLVLDHWATARRAYRVRLDNGEDLIASGDHRFLTANGWRYVIAPGRNQRARLHLQERDTCLGPGKARLKARGLFKTGPRDVASTTAGAVAAVETLGVSLPLFDIATATGDFVANGVVSHNCYARPSHSYLELSPGLDFETKLYAKTNAAALLREELSKPGYRPAPIALGANTDCYQPIERKHGITRQILEVLAECGHPVTIVTKSALIERDLDILAPMGKRNLVKVFVSIGTLDRVIARKLEPRAASPQRRVDVLKALSGAGVPCGVMVAALIPALNDKTLEQVLEAAAAAGAREAAYVILRLPHELKAVFKEWLATHYPERAGHVMSIVRQMRGGRENDPDFGSRMTGKGNYAELIEKRFDIACRRFGLNGHGAGRHPPELDCTRFRPPARHGQMTLF
jgi:DNA repair photolyase